jgi:hypothetical protein
MWLETTEGILSLISTGLVLLGGLITVSVKLYNAIKQIIKDKNWRKIIAIADRAMEAAEKSGASGADKKAQVIEAVKAGCLEMGIDAMEYIDQLSTYIDECIKFFNDMKEASREAKINTKKSK